MTQIPLSDLIILLLGGAGWAFFLGNKLPKPAYAGKGWAARLLNCLFCLGTEIGWVLTAAVIFIYACCPWIRVPLLAVCAGPAVGLVAMLVQKPAQVGTAPQVLAEKEDE